MGTPKLRGLVTAERRRVLIVYALLVILPALAAVLLLVNVNGDDKGGHPSITVHNPVARFLLALAAVLVATRLFGALAARLGQPTVIGELLAGILLGPTLFGAVASDASEWLFTPGTIAGLDALAQLAVVIFIFGIGVALPLDHLRSSTGKAVVIGHAAFAVPFAMGVGFAVLFDELRPEGVGFTTFAMFCGVALSVTALPVLARILSERGLERTWLGVLGLTSAGIIDVTAWTMLAVITLSGSQVNGFVVKLVLTVAFAVAVIVVLRPLLKTAVERLKDRPAAVAVLALVTMLACAATTDLLGLHSIFGAFAAGLAMPRAEILTIALRGVHTFTDYIGLPVFFVVIGLSTDLGLLTNLTDVGVIAILIAIAVGGKLGGAALAARAVGLRVRPALSIGVMMNCRGLTELVVLNVGLGLGLIGQDLFAALVLMALLTTAATEPLLRWCATRPKRYGSEDCLYEAPKATPEANPAPETSPLAGARS